MSHTFSRELGISSGLDDSLSPADPTIMTSTPPKEANYIHPPENLLKSTTLCHWNSPGSLPPAQPGKKKPVQTQMLQTPPTKASTSKTGLQLQSSKLLLQKLPMTYSKLA